MTTLGRVALYLVFALTVYAAVAGVLAGRRGDRRLMRSARNAFWAALAATLVAVVSVEYALLTHDFSLAVVAEHTGRRLPTGYTLSGT